MDKWHVVFAILLIAAAATVANAQWTSEWTSPAVSDSFVDGWLPFQQSGSTWLYRYYTIDSSAFRVMSSPESQAAAYTYTFTAAERLAGNYIYSLNLDLTSDGITDFYVLSYYVSGATYRQAVKILDVTSGATIFQLDQAGASFSYPTIFDVDNDGVLEAVFTRYNVPSTAQHTEVVYQTGVSASALSSAALPRQLNLRQNYPNPFNPNTRIEYELRSPGHVRMDILNVLGQRVSTVVNGMEPAGTHAIEWNGTDTKGAVQSSGSYFYRISVDGKALQTKEMLLVR